MRIIHAGQKAKYADYADIGEIVREISEVLARNEGIPQVLQIYTYPEEAFLKRGAKFFSPEEIERLCRELQSLMSNYPNVILCFGILRKEKITTKDFLINSALLFHSQDFMAFDKQVIYYEDTLWKHICQKDEPQNFIGDYINYIDGGIAEGSFSHIYFVPGFSVEASDAPMCPDPFSKMTITTDSFRFPDQMLVSDLMGRTTGTVADSKWRNYMLVETPEKTIAIWVGICKEIPTKNFLQRYEFWHEQIRFDAEVTIILTNDLTLERSRDKLPRIPLLENNKRSSAAYTKIIRGNDFHIFENGIFEI